MKNFSSSDLKAVLHSKRANLFYLEYCRVMQKDVHCRIGSLEAINKMD